MAAPDWPTLLADAATHHEVTCTVRRHDGGLTSATKPQKFVCDDGNLYAVKFKQNNHGDGRGIFNEQVVPGLGHLVGAPVPPVARVSVPEEHAEALVKDRATLGMDFDAEAGVHHGSRWADGYSDRQDVAHVDENRERFAALDVLLSWIGAAGDFQLIYRNAAPHEVLSRPTVTGAERRSAS